MNCFIGGSGSTGSSVLANVLNRHSEIYCGPETYLFTKHQLFEDWEGSKTEILGGKLKSYPWHRYSKVDLDQENIWKPNALRALINYSKSLAEFSEEYFLNNMRSNEKSYWMEKTPSNVYCFPNLVQHFPECFLIHTIRNPYDCIASLNRRGYSVYYATCLYLLNTSIGLSMESYAGYKHVIYEEMVTKPEPIIKDLCNFLGIEFEYSMLLKSKSEGTDDIESWNLSEHSEIKANSVGTFATISRFVQEEIVYMVNAMRISGFYQRKYNLECVDIESICKKLGFQHYEDDGYHNIFQLQIDKTRDHINRIIRSYPSKFSQYPILLKV